MCGIIGVSGVPTIPRLSRLQPALRPNLRPRRWTAKVARSHRGMGLLRYVHESALD
jgi:hypothetical protein